LPSPMGDAVLCTGALRAIRNRFRDASICFLASKTVRDILSPSQFNDGWVDYDKGTFKLALILRKMNFTRVILFKNSFSSALTVFLAGIPNRIGYARDGRTFMLTDKVHPKKTPMGKFKPAPMLDYYMNLAEHIGCDIHDRVMELSVEPADLSAVKDKLPDALDPDKPLIILVPGGAFGPSKCWPSDRFAKTADALIEKYNANIVVSVSPNQAEINIANQICQSSSNEITSLAKTQLTLGQLKALYANAALVITNDTGPRHISIALKRNLITMFGPNNPQWTQTGYANETQIVGKAPCVPCDKPTCSMNEHLCMESITVEQVCQAAEKYLTKHQQGDL
ncbi:MAG: lipopolysaccharide heptosyltransferase II, partial [Anaerohalosphaera sp.]|nr:lipopolysaccharide heptosyltransferase II [Anaerohalosphaera sp.]